MYRYFTFLITVIIISCDSGSTNDLVPSDEVETTKGIDSSTLNWLSYTPEVFEKAKAENKLILLEVGANWCHWCHVMDDKTYADSEIQDYLNQHFILAREDQDARPDLSAAYIKWGWPAIIIQNAEGEDLIRLKGYQEKTKFLNILKEAVKNPTTVSINENSHSPSVSASNNFLFQEFLGRIDHQKGGFNWNHKYLHLPGLKHALKYYKQNDSLKNWADIMVSNSFNLVDPEWGGVYQYSAKRNWNNPHFEKLLRNQGQCIEAYSRYFYSSGSQLALKKALMIYGYCHKFLQSKTPLFYNSQNADLICGVHSEEFYDLSSAERYKKGVPSIDKNVYLKENAFLAKSFMFLWAATDNIKYLEQATLMTDHILVNYPSQNGLFRRQLSNQTIFSLEDNMAFLSLLCLVGQSSGETKYLKSAEKLGHSIIEQFDSEKGLVASSGELTIDAKAIEHKNIGYVSDFSLLGYLTKNDVFNSFASGLYDKIDKNALQKNVAYIPDLMLANEHVITEPFHVLYISDLQLENTKPEQRLAYFKEALKSNKSTVLFESMLKEEMTDEQKSMYGSAASGSVFICTSTYCSAPIKGTENLSDFLASN